MKISLQLLTEKYQTLTPAQHCGSVDKKLVMKSNILAHPLPQMKPYNIQQTS